MSDISVFISFKVTDELGEFSLAKRIYEDLTELGVSVFFSSESLIEEGASDFIDSINEALNSAIILICIASCPEFLNSKWPSYERKKFFNDIMSNRKSGDIFTVLNGFNPLELPDPLTNYQFFKKEQLEQLYRTILSNLAKKQVSVKSNLMDPYEFSKQKLNVYPTRKFIVRDCIKDAVSNFLVSENRCCFLCGKRGMGISTFLANLASELMDSRNVLYVSDVSEMGMFQKHIVEGNLSYVIIDALRNPEQLEILKNTIVMSKTAKFICGITISVDKNLLSSINSSFPFDRFVIPPLSFDEVSSIVLEDMDSSSADPLLRFLRRTQVSFFYNASILVLLKLLVKDGVDFSTVDILDVFSMLEEKMETSETFSSLNRLLDSFNDYKNYPEMSLGAAGIDSLFRVLIDSGILEKKLNKFRVSDSDLPLVNYMLASRIFSQFNYDFNIKLLEGKEDVIGMYFGIISKDDVFSLIDYDFSIFHTQQLFRIMNYSFTNEDSIVSLCNNQAILRNVLNFIQYKTNHGLYDYSRWLLNILKSYNVVSQSDYEAEKLILDYYSQGTYSLNERYLDNERYCLYYGKIEYNADHYDVANRYIKRALDLCSDDVFFLDFIKLNYVEVLIDCNEIEKAMELIDELDVSPNLSKEQKIQLNNHKGVLYTCQRQFAKATVCYNMLFKLFGENELSSKWYGKSFGDLALCQMYMGKYDEALHNARKNTEVMISAKNYIGLSCSLDIYAQILFLKKEYNKAFKYFSIALIYAKQTSNEWRSIVIRLFMNLFMFQHNDEYYSLDSIRNDIKSIDSDAFLAWPYCLLSLNYWIRGEKDKAINLYRSFISVINKTVDLEKKELFRFLYKTYLGEEIKGTHFAEDLLDSVQDLIQNRKDTHIIPFCNIEVEPCLWLKKFLPFDYPSVFEYASDSETTRYMIWPKHKSINDSIEYINSTLKKEIESDYFCWAIELNGKIIGAIDMTSCSDGSYEIGYILNRKYWRKGIMSKCVDKVLNYFERFGFNRFWGIVFKDNIASLSLLKKNRFVVVEQRENKEGIDEIVLKREANLEEGIKR